MEFSITNLKTLEDKKFNSSKDNFTKYKKGDKVRVKSLEWYNKSKDYNGNVIIDSFGHCFNKEYSQYCNMELTINKEYNSYSFVENGNKYVLNVNWYDVGVTDLSFFNEMFE